MNLKELRARLVEHYRRVDDVRRMAADAGLPVGVIRFDGASVDNAWWGVLEEARLRPAALRTLITAAAEDYPGTFLSVLDVLDDLLAAREEKPSLAPPRRPVAGSVQNQLEAAIANLTLQRGAGAPEEVLRAATQEVIRLKRALRAGGQLTVGYPIGNRYTLTGKLGIGGFAEVWKAWDQEEHRYVAVKVLHGQWSHDRSRRERFFRGAHRMMKLDHPHIVKVFEPQCEDDGFHYIVMEWLRGGDLQSALKNRLMHSDEALELLLDIAAALAFTHDAGVIHRDVKPSNILLDDNGQGKLSDFDLVRASDTTGGTQGGLGTFVYAAPEAGAPEAISGEFDRDVVRSATEVGPRADVYSLGMTAACLVHGHPLDRWVVYGRQQFIKGLDCSDNMRSVIERAIAIDPAARFASARDFATALQTALDESFSDSMWVENPDTGDLELTAKPLPVPRKPAVDQWRGRPSLCLITPGAFMMGSPELEKQRIPNEVHREVRITRPFLMATTPVTQAQYRVLMGSNPSARVGDDLPVERVSWIDAVRYCNVLSTRERLTPYYDILDGGRRVSVVHGANGFRLPTEAQWEYACRAGSERRFSTGDRVEDLSRVGWFAGNTETSQSVAQLPANSWGLHDMHGNVWEWCHDTYGPYGSGPAEDPVSVSRSKRRVLRGGAHNTPAYLARSAARFDAPYDAADGDYGFRLVLPVEYQPTAVNRPAMTYIPAGEFAMGEGEETRTVQLREPYLLATTPITQAQYRTVLGTKPSHFKGGDNPVESVTWFDAVTFCNALSEAEDRAPAYRVDGARVERLPGADGYRLPTEAEWEYACRAGTDTVYWAGDEVSDLERVGWVNNNGGGMTHPVSQKPHNPWGLFDMHGNVWEWCHDWFDSVSVTATADPFGAGRGTHRIQRGGSFSCPPQKAEAGHRGSLVPDKSYDDLGFRVMRPLGSSAKHAARIRAEATSNQPAHITPSPALPATEGRPEMVILPATRWIMGSPEDEPGRKEDEAKHEVVSTQPFLMATTPVTQAQYRAVMLSNPSQYKGDDRPVDSMLWNDAARFCITLSLREGLEPAYLIGDQNVIVAVPEADGYRLPTEAEWEYACRAGSSTAYHFGDAIDAGLEHFAWYEGPENAASLPVAQKKVNPWGLYDLAGNISEWCYDYYGPYPSSSVVDPMGPQTGDARVIRGGHWASTAVELRSACRDALDPMAHRPTVGFRIVRRTPRAVSTPHRPAMRYLPAGRFLMGSPPDEIGHMPDESLREVVLSRPVFMAETLITQAQYESVTGKTPSHHQGKTLPVERVKWLDAVDFCNALSAKEQLSPAYRRDGNLVHLVEGAMGYRLPTEAEWEYACRAGSRGPYADGVVPDTLGEGAWFTENSKRRSHPVGEKTANGWGLYDMRGNVWEWCHDLYQKHLLGPVVDPTGAPLDHRRQGGERETRRVRRGGSFNSRAHQLRAAFRARNEPNEVFNSVGFRIVRPIAE